VVGIEFDFHSLILNGTVQDVQERYAWFWKVNIYKEHFIFHIHILIMSVQVNMCLHKLCSLCKSIIGEAATQVVSAGEGIICNVV
jgi:hypothetical protein